MIWRDQHGDVWVAIGARTLHFKRSVYSRVRLEYGWPEYTSLPVIAQRAEAA